MADAGLAGVRVVDMTEGVAGPYATSLLGDMGADVVKVERPAGDWGRTSGQGGADGVSAHFAALNRNKRALGLDLRQPGAEDVIRRLVGRADVIVSNFRPGVMDQLGLGYAACAELNPSLVYCAISAFGEDGAYAKRPGSDTILQAISGLMSVIGEPDGPPLRVSFTLIDLAAALYAVQGVLLALYERDRRPDRHGRRVEVSLLNAGLALQTAPFTDFLTDGVPPRRQGNQNPALSPAGAFACADGTFLTVAVLRESHWPKFCDAVGLPELVADPRFADNGRRLAHRGELNAVLEPIFRSRSRVEWLAALGAADVLCAPVNDYADVMADPGLAEAVSTLEFTGPAGPLRTVGNPVRLDGAYFAASAGPPRLGEHSTDVLTELGYTSDEIAGLLRSGISVQAEERSGSR